MSSHINILFIGDLVGNVGVDLACTLIPSFVEKYNVDCLIVNGENAMEGKSISEAQAARLFELGVHAITSGNHIWEKWHIQKLMAKEPRLLRPANYPRDNAGRGYVIVDLGAKGKVGVLNLQGRTFMNPIECPFRASDWIIPKIREEANVIFIDMHAEATAEKMALAWYLDGRVSAVVGTHTHIQTNDARILPDGTAYLTDVGMTGPYESVLGMRKDIAIKRFLKQTPFKFEMASNDVHLSAVLLKVDYLSGKAEHIETIFYPEFPENGNNN
jgi:2',3'-cyclic-nucleotide 2'-phosphodiesterase